jgi:hypothetical protein
MSTRAPHMEYRLEVIDGFMRPIFDGMEPKSNELMWELLLPFTAGAAALLGEIKRVESGELTEWGFETPIARITCTPKTLKLEDKCELERGCGPLQIKMPLKEAALLLGRWLFECVWREQQRREQIAGDRAHV